MRSRMCGVAANRKVCLAVGLGEIGVGRPRQATPESVNHAVAAERRRCDDRPANRARMPDGRCIPT